jgi:hypothetical protein
MTVLIAMFFGLVGGAIACVLGAIIAFVIAEMTHVTNMEGARGYFAIMIAIPSGIVGMIVSMVITLRWRGVTHLAGVLGGSVAAFAGLVAIVACIFGLYYLTIVQVLDQRIYLSFEIALPPGSASPDLSTWDAELNATKTRMSSQWNSKANGVFDGRPTVRGIVQLVYRVSDRQLILRMPNDEVRVFLIRLPGNPNAAKYRTWSKWHKADFANGPAKGADYMIRYQIED